MEDVDNSILYVSCGRGSLDVRILNMCVSTFGQLPQEGHYYQQREQHTSVHKYHPIGTMWYNHEWRPALPLPSL